MHPCYRVIMLMYDKVTPVLMLVPLVEVLKGANGKRCGRFGGGSDVRGEILEMIADLNFPCLNCRERRCCVCGSVC